MTASRCAMTAADKADGKATNKKADRKDRTKPRCQAAKPSPTTSRSIPNCRPMTLPTMAMRRRSLRRKKRALAQRPLRVSQRTLGRALQQEDRGDDRRPEIQGRAGAVGRAARGARAKGDGGYCCFWIRFIATPPARPASPMSMSGTDLSTRPAASCSRGPDFEGQPRKLRSDDGVYFTKPGARKLAHYVEREITRLLAARSAPFALPTEPATPDANAQAGPAGAASAGRTDRAAGGLLGRHRSIARRSRLAPGRGRCAGRANAGQGRAAGAARRPRRRFCLAAPRGRTRTGQGRIAGRLRLPRMA